MKYPFLLCLTFLFAFSCAKKNQDIQSNHSENETILENNNDTTPQENNIPRIIPSLLIHDIWALTELNGEPSANFKGDRPTIELFPNENRVSGNGGCNYFNGAIEFIDDTNIKFGLLMTTLRACEGMKMESEILNMLEKVDAYKIEDLQLSFMDENGNTIAKYKKVD